MKSAAIVSKSLNRYWASCEREFIIFAAILLTVLPLAPAGATKDIPQRDLKAYTLEGAPHSADISPDEKLVVTQTTRLDPTDDPAMIRVVELAQLWDFRLKHLVAEVPLLEATVAKGRTADGSIPGRFARFTSDGQLICVHLNHFLYVLSGIDLHEIRRIQLDGPPGVARSYKSRKTGIHSFVEKSNLSILELSPVGHKAAVVWTGDYPLSGQVELYDLDSGSQLSQWNTRDRELGVLQPRALAWMPNGRQFVLAIPNEFACSSPGSGSDLFVVDATSGTIQMKFRSGLLVGDIAVTRDGRVWAADSACVGVFKNHNPKLKVFDIHTGKRVRELSVRDSGVRYAVTASRNGDRVAAYTGKIKVDFDWSDMVSYGVPVAETFSVWNANNYEPLVTSQNLTRPRQEIFSGRPPLRTSPNGNFVLFGKTIYELPDNSEKN
jgi:hypothetical protein